MGSKRCPHCGSELFLAKVIRGAAVKAEEDGTFKVMKETPEYQLEVFKCNKCKADVTEADLVEMIKCTKCGSMTRPDLVDENGVCDVCQALVQRTDLAGASREDLLRMILNLEKQTPTTKSLEIQAKVEKSESVMDDIVAAQTQTSAAVPTVDPVTDATTESTEETQTQDAPATTTAKRRIRKKNQTDAEDTSDTNADASAEEITQAEDTTVDPLQTAQETVETTAESLPVTGTDITTEMDNISQNQAPFPDTEDPFLAINQPIPAQAPVQASLGGFNMFEDQDAF